MGDASTADVMERGKDAKTNVSDIITLLERLVSDDDNKLFRCDPNFQ